MIRIRISLPPFRFPLALAAALLLLGSWPGARAAIAFQPRHTVLLYGNSMIERLSESGHLEAYLQLATPALRIKLRSLAWTGDEAGHRMRPEGYADHLRNLLQAWPAQTVIIGFGMNEAFAGLEGLNEFKQHLEIYLDELKRRHPNAGFVLLSPIAVENRPHPSHPDPEARNRVLESCAKLMSGIAEARGVRFIDLFAASLVAYARHEESLTTQGFQLNERGSREIGAIIARNILGEAAWAAIDFGRVEEVAQAAALKSRHAAELVRPKNAVIYYGVRKRPEEYAAEMPRYHALIEASEAILHDLVANPAKRFADFPFPSLPPLPVGNTKDAGKGAGVIKPPQEQQAEFKVAPGYEVNLFASEREFPDLRNPVQIEFDAQGRLWIVTMPSFPHTVPGRPPEDKILILEDINRDGRADRSTVFAEGFDALDGIAFHEDGVIVSAQPRLLLLRDTNGDGQADERRELLRGIDVTDSHHGGMVAVDPMGHILFCDGVFHRSQIETPFGVTRGFDATTYRFNPATGRVESEWQSITPNPWKITFDRYGNIFQMYGDGLVLDGLALTWTPLGIYHPFRYGTTVDYGKGSAAAVISSPNFPDRYQQGMASAALLGSYAVSLTRYGTDQGMVTGSERLDVLSSQNPAFRPVDLAFGFDGALYVSDFCSAIIGHAQHPMRDPQWDKDHGRIWRVTHSLKPVARDWPVLAGAPLPRLLRFLPHPQDIVRRHARTELKAIKSEILLPAVDAWIQGFDRTGAEFALAALEALWIFESKGEARPALLEELLASPDPLFRGAATRLIRFQVERLPNAHDLLTRMGGDPHPRVRMEVVDAAAHLRPVHPRFEHVLHAVNASDSIPVQQMLNDLRHGVRPARGRSVEVLELAANTRLNHWLTFGTNALKETRPFDAQAPVERGLREGVFRTWVQAAKPAAALLAVKHGYLDVAVNDAQLLSFDTMWSSDQQVQFDLRPGLNLIEVAFRNLRGAVPPVYLSDPLGQPLADARAPSDSAELRAWAGLAQQQAIPDGVLRIQAVPHKLQFSPKEARVRAGVPVRLILDNPDLMIHNWVLVEVGAEMEIGLLADRLAAQPDGLARAYVPESKKVLQATGLINPGQRAELVFTAPAAPGRYPFICTFPGHWRIMRGTLIVEE